MQKKCLNYTQETTLHGINHATDRNRLPVQRGVWLLLFLGALASFLFYFITGVQRFLRYDVATTLDYRTQSAIEFPSVTLCNYNTVRKSYVQSLNDSFYFDVVNSLNPALPLALNMSDPVTIQRLKSFTIDDVTVAGAHQRNMFIACSFMSQNISSGPCRFSPELMKETVTQMGSCFTFHPSTYLDAHGGLVSTRAGAAGGLFLRINIEQFDYLSGRGAAGLKVVVHDPYVEPLVAELGSSVHPGTETNMVVTRLELDNMPAPYGNSTCQDTSQASFVNPLRYFDHYSYSACKQECFTQFVVDACGCRTNIMTAPSIPACDVFTFMACGVPKMYEFFANESNSAACDCVHPCREVQYTVSQSAAFFPNDNLAASLKLMYNQSEEFFRKNFVDLNVFYGELGFTRIVQSADYPVSSMFAELGGFMGLFLGASLLTLAELLEFLLTALPLCCSARLPTAKGQPRDGDGDCVSRQTTHTQVMPFNSKTEGDVIHRGTKY